MRGTTHTQVDTLRKLFDTQDQVQHQLIAKDADDSNRQWYLNTTCLTMQNMRGTTVEFVLHLADSVWRVVTPSTGTKAVTASGDQVTLTALGNKNAHPIITVTPTSTPTSTYTYKRRVNVRNRTTGNLQTYPLEVTNGGLDTATLVGAGKMRADGYDLRVMVDGLETNWWIADINTNHTKVWIALDLLPKIELTLAANVANSGLVDIQITKTSANTAALKLLPSGAALLLDNELIVGGIPNLALMKIPTTARATGGTTIAAHTAGITVYWIPHDIWILYGLAGATQAVIDDGLKPLFNLSSSTNSSWVYNTNFLDANNARTGAWTNSIIKTDGDQTHIYTATLDTLADLATAMGMSINVFQKGTKWVAETAQLLWELTNSCGIDSITATGKTYRYTATWPVLAALQHSSNGKTWVTDWNQGSPASLQTWTAWSQALHATGSASPNVRFLLSGMQPASASAVASFEILTATAALTSANVPSVSLSAEQTNCQLSCTITNTTTGESFTIIYPLATTKSLVVDCNLHTVTADGIPSLSAIGISTIRTEWLDLLPGVNLMQYDQVSTGNVTLGFSWEDRSL
jgi:hypothetical protein